MTVVTVREAKAQLPWLISRAERGEEIVVTRFGRPAVRLLAVEPRQERMFGVMPISVPDGFFEHLGEEEIAAWE